MNFRAWKLGLIFASITGSVSALANVAIFKNATWGELAASLIPPAALGFINYIQKHPVDTIQDTGFRFPKKQNDAITKENK